MRQEVLAGPERRRCWSDGEKIAIVREASDGRSSVAAVARRHDLSRQQIYQWRSAMRRGELVDGDGGGFLAVEFAGEITADAASRADDPRDAIVEISLRKGRALRVPASIAPAVLTALIRAAEAA
jgi:transposase